MKVTVKVVQGAECVVEILPTESILDLKYKVENKLGIGVDQQKLLFSGKPLSDENRISFYPGIKDGVKINLIAKKSDPSSNQLIEVKPGLINLANEIIRVLKQYYLEHEAKLIASKIVIDLKNKVNHLSYDDIERLATALIHDLENLV